MQHKESKPQTQRVGALPRNGPVGLIEVKHTKSKPTDGSSAVDKLANNRFRAIFEKDDRRQVKTSEQSELFSGDAVVSNQEPMLPEVDTIAVEFSRLQLVRLNLESDYNQRELQWNQLKQQQQLLPNMTNVMLLHQIEIAVKNIESQYCQVNLRMKQLIELRSQKVAESMLHSKTDILPNIAACSSNSSQTKSSAVPALLELNFDHILNDQHVGSNQKGDRSIQGSRKRKAEFDKNSGPSYHGKKSNPASRSVVKPGVHLSSERSSSSEALNRNKKDWNTNTSDGKAKESKQILDPPLIVTIGRQGRTVTKDKDDDSEPMKSKDSGKVKMNKKHRWGGKQQKNPRIRSPNASKDTVPPYSLHCQTCEVYFHGTFDIHRLTSEHTGKLRSLLQEGCKLCSITKFGTYFQRKNHLKSASHLDNAKGNSQILDEIKKGEQIPQSSSNMEVEDEPAPLTLTTSKATSTTAQSDSAGNDSSAADVPSSKISPAKPRDTALSTSGRTLPSTIVNSSKATSSVTDTTTPIRIQTSHDDVAAKSSNVSNCSSNGPIINRPAMSVVRSKFVATPISSKKQTVREQATASNKPTSGECVSDSAKKDVLITKDTNLVKNNPTQTDDNEVTCIDPPVATPVGENSVAETPNTTSTNMEISNLEPTSLTSFSKGKLDKTVLSKVFQECDGSTGFAIGQEFVIPVSGFFCKLCHKFYSSENIAKVQHCMSKTHYEKLQTYISSQLQPIARSTPFAQRSTSDVTAEIVDFDKTTDDTQYVTVKEEPNQLISDNDKTIADDDQPMDTESDAAVEESEKEVRSSSDAEKDAEKEAEKDLTNASDTEDRSQNQALESDFQSRETDTLIDTSVWKKDSNINLDVDDLSNEELDYLDYDSDSLLLDDSDNDEHTKKSDKSDISKDTISALLRTPTKGKNLSDEEEDDDDDDKEPRYHATRSEKLDDSASPLPLPLPQNLNESCRQPNRNEFPNFRGNNRRGTPSLLAPRHKRGMRIRGGARGGINQRSPPRGRLPNMHSAPYGRFPHQPFRPFYQ